MKWQESETKSREGDLKDGAGYPSNTTGRESGSGIFLSDGEKIIPDQVSLVLENL